MRSLLKFKLICVLLISFGNINAQDSFILNYEDVDIKKVTQDIAQFSKTEISVWLGFESKKLGLARLF